MSHWKLTYAFWLIPLIGGLLCVDEATAARKLYVLTAVDTLDETIGKPSKADVVAVRTMLSENVADSELVLLDQLTDAHVTKDGILGAIAQLSPAPNDAVLMYYSGHGAHFQDDEHFLVAQAGKEQIPRNVVLNSLKQKGFGLVVLITDSCFNFSEKPRPRQGYAMTRAPDITAPLFRKLFFQTSGVIDLNSAKKGQVSGTNPMGQGSIFTSAFCSILRANKSDASLSWDGLLNKVDTAARADFLKFYPEGIEVNTPTGLINQRDQKLARLTFDLRPVSAPGGGDKPIPNNPGNPGDDNGANNPGPIITRGRTTSVRLGVTVEDRDRGGVTILAVAKGGPATRCIDRSGQSFLLERGDSITAINGIEFSNTREFSNAVRSSSTEIRLAVIGKDGDARTFTTRLVALGGGGGGGNNGEQSGTRFGAYIVAKGNTVLVKGIVPDSPAERCRDRKGQIWHLERGDIILQVNGRDITSEAEYREAIANSPRVLILEVHGSDGKDYHFTATLNY